MLYIIPACMYAKSIQSFQLFATPWTVAQQGPPAMGFSRQEYWSGLPFPSPGNLPDPGIKPMSPALAGGFFTASTAWEAKSLSCCCCCCSAASVVSDSARPHRRQPTRLPRPWDSPGKNTGVGCHFLLQCLHTQC